MEYKIIKVRGIGQSALIIDDDGRKIERIEEASRFFFDMLNSYAGQGWRILTVVTNGNELVYVMQREPAQAGPMETKKR